MTLSEAKSFCEAGIERETEIGAKWWQSTGEQCLFAS